MYEVSFETITSIPSEAIVATNIVIAGVLFAKFLYASKMVCGESLLITKALRALTQSKMK